jgi:hypothetical protein
MAAGKTYEPIATTTLSSATSAIDFSSITSAYTDLVLVLSWRGGNADQPSLLVRLNNSTAQLYSNTGLTGSGSGAGTSRRASTAINGNNYMAIPRDAGQPTTVGGMATIIINFMNYSKTTMFKTVLGRGSAAESGVEATVGMWRSTSAVNQITISGNTNAFGVGTTATLYGIAAA